MSNENLIKPPVSRQQSRALVREKAKAARPQRPRKAPKSMGPETDLLVNVVCSLAGIEELNRERRRALKNYGEAKLYAVFCEVALGQPPTDPRVAQLVRLRLTEELQRQRAEVADVSI